MDNRPIGIFDSGFGGLTALTALRRLMPDENIIFFADRARAPYGARSAGELRVIARQDLEFVASFGVKAIIAACGTVSANAPDVIADFDIPSVGVLEESVRTMSVFPGDAPLGIIATAASIRSGLFERRLRALCPGREIITAACPDFVTLIESGHFSPEDPAVRTAVEKYLRAMKEAGVRELLLGCTHYGLISEAIDRYLGGKTTLVSASECTALAVSRMLTDSGMTGGEGKTDYYTSGSAREFDEKAAMLLGHAIEGAISVPVMEVPPLI